MPFEVIKDADITAQHGSFTNVGKSTTVFVQGGGVIRVTDQWATHNSDPTHTLPTQSSGSGTVFAEGLPIARTGDDISCGATNTIPVARTVFAGD